MKILVPLFSVTAGVALLQAGLALGQETAGGSSSRTFKSSSSKTRDSVRPLFIEFTPASRDNATTMEEDLNVMSGSSTRRWIRGWERSRRR
jgi:hypothetical protein